ncbi:hypothetical protein IFR04_012272 [Cadophora malorum]|uniref:Uncharacterized protein n=1 Tax=Cadophora malorum TaxID=108018 RepID=A0A8H7T3K1_9HELO|nr:hypothetical protein IFR04_012272 [Cadophora malorum]
MVSTYIIISAVIAFIAVALGAAYTTGALDPVIEQMGIMFFKAKAEAEKKKLQAQGMKEGEDFMDDQLKGNKQAGDIASGLGGIGGLKKGL